MAVSLAELILLGLLVDWLFRKLHIPGLVGMLFVGVVLGPYVLGNINPALMAISADLRKIALIVILLRAGFELSSRTLARIGTMAALLSCVPVILEAAAITLFGRRLLGLTYMESAILGCILAAVSPAVVVPMMIDFIKRRMGAKKGIPTLVLAASSVNDVFVIVIYSGLVGIYLGQKVSIASKLMAIPVSIVLGITVGLCLGWILYLIFKRFNPRSTKRVLTILAISVLLIRVEHGLENIIPFAALLAVMSVGFIILEKNEHYAHEISAKLGKIWVFAEIILFTMVGTQVNIPVAFKAGFAGAALIGIALIARSIGTYLCLLGSNLTTKERLFVVISYSPKGTVQAAIGAAPLAAMKLAGLNTGPGEVILAVAVLSIILTAPLGAWAISITGNRILQVAPPEFKDSYQAASESEAKNGN